MSYVLVTVSSGLIANVSFFETPSVAVKALSEFVKTMNPEKEDAAVYGPNGLVANPKAFLDDHDQFIEVDPELIEAVATAERNRPIYIIGNPEHKLGFMVVSPDDPLGYADPTEAVSELAQMRMDHGCHLKLYRVTPVTSPVTTVDQVEKHNAPCWVDEFHPALVQEYLG